MASRCVTGRSERTLAEPPFGAGIGVLPVKTLAVQMWTFWVPTNRLGLGSPTASRIRWAACNRRDALTVQ
jgi:hypothetical protein